MTVVYHALARSNEAGSLRELETDFLLEEEAIAASSKFADSLKASTDIKDWTASVISLEKEIKLPK